VTAKLYAKYDSELTQTRQLAASSLSAAVRER
jgi:hypothetical protein